MTENREMYGEYSVDDEDQLQFGDSLLDRGVVDALDEGYSPPERWSAAERYGNTPLEEELGESLEMRLLQEEPEPDPYLAAEQEQEHAGHEVGHLRAGRLVADDEGNGPDLERELVASDVRLDAELLMLDGSLVAPEVCAVQVAEGEPDARLQRVWEERAAPGGASADNSSDRSLLLPDSCQAS